MNLRWTRRERVGHVVAAVGRAFVASLTLPAIALHKALHEAKRHVRPRPWHLRTCGIEYRGCDPECPARAWDEAYAKEDNRERL